MKWANRRMGNLLFVVEMRQFKRGQPANRSRIATGRRLDVDVDQPFHALGGLADGARQGVERALDCRREIVRVGSLGETCGAER